MATLTLKQVPDALLEQLRSKAKRERRSLNQEALRILELGVEGKRSSVMEAIERFRREAGPLDPKVFKGLRQRGRGRPVRL